MATATNAPRRGRPRKETAQQADLIPDHRHPAQAKLEALGREYVEHGQARRRIKEQMIEIMDQEGMAQFRCDGVELDLINPPKTIRAKVTSKDNDEPEEERPQTPCVVCQKPIYGVPPEQCGECGGDMHLNCKAKHECPAT